MQTNAPPSRQNRIQPASPVLKALILALSSLPAWATAPDALRFIALGDTPYSEEESRVLRDQLAPAIRAAAPAFLVHYGDFKNGKTNCSKALLTGQRDQIYGLLPGRVLYTPGDNEWTDCDRSILSYPEPELGKLDLIRKLFFSPAPGLPVSWRATRQANFPENARWSMGGIMFVTLHWVGTNNGRKEIQRDDTDLALAMVDAREQANRVWLDTAFQHALAEDSQALVLITHADVTHNMDERPCTLQERSNCDAFADFRQQLRQRAHGFSSSKPVLLIHGDTHPYCWDKQFGGPTAPNLWRLNAWGDFQKPADATEITVRPGNPAEPFSARTLVNRIQPAGRCI
jgi:hypothetical protein